MWTAALAGAIAGLVIGAAQWLALRRIGVDVSWIAATAVGLAVGLSLAFAVNGYGDTVGDLAILGAVSGLSVGLAQWWLLRDLVGATLVLIPATSAFSVLGWTVTTAIGVDPDDRWAVPGLVWFRDVDPALRCCAVGSRSLWSTCVICRIRESSTSSVQACLALYVGA